MAGGSRIALIALAWLSGLLAVQSAPQRHDAQQPPPAGGVQFKTSDNCLACHNSLMTAATEDVSIGANWRASMMANSARDPYWQASVRREIIDHPSAQKAIEDECSVCHMPMARTLARSAGRLGEIFEHLPIGRSDGDAARLAADGVSCSLCHQIGAARLGTPESFTGRYAIEPARPTGPNAFGPFEVDRGRSALMHSATGAVPTEASHIGSSELCATCHTLFTEALDGQGRAIGSLPEQVPFLEWRHSAFRTERSCQSCHMPEVAEAAAVSSVLGEPRHGVSRHTFVGGNFFMLRLLNRYRPELGVEALPSELEAATRMTLAQLQTETATVSVNTTIAGGLLTADVAVGNTTGHKLPTGYPSRRTWLHVAVRDRSGRLVFESGGLEETGAIRGNDHDADGRRFEPHHDEIRSAEDVQIYESIMADASGVPTTGLLSAVRFMKDNRLLPRGFDKASADADIAVRGEAAADADFNDEGDRIRYVVKVDPGDGPFQVEVELRYQPISFRWAANLKSYDAVEPRRFVSYYDAMAAQSSTILARASVRVR